MKPSFGPASILGYLGALGGFIVASVQSAESNQALFTGHSKPAALLAFASLLATNAHRAFESAHLNKAAGVASEAAALPAALAALANEAQQNIAAAQAAPDAADGPQVDFAQPSAESTK